MALLIGEILSRAASVTPAGVAATLGDDTWSFAEADHRATAAANVLSALGVARGDRVASFSALSLTDIDGFIGCARIGAAFVPLNPSYTIEEAEAVITYVRPRVLLADVLHREQAESLALEHDLPLAIVGEPSLTAPSMSFEEQLAHADGRVVRAPGPSEEDVHVIFLTSGSTGRPKGVAISQRANFLRHFNGAALNLTCGPGGEVCTFPLFHMAGWLMLLLSWSASRPIHLVARPDPDVLLGEIERRRARTMYAIPAIWKRVLEQGGNYDTSSLEWALTGTSRLSPEFLAALKERFPGSRTTVAYGSTEAGSSARLGDEDLFRKPFSVGIPAPGVEAKLVDGELWLRTDMLMSGYFDMPAETADVLVDGWYRTGDLARIDTEGYISIVGRRTETIRSAAEFIAPVEVENALAGYPGIVEVAVVGVPDETWGEIVTAVVVLQQGAPVPSVEELRAHVAGTLAPFKHPRRVVCRDRLPRTAATGQVQRRKLQQELAAATGSEQP